MVAFCFTLVFMFDIGNIFIANIIYYVLLIMQILKKGTISFKKNNPLYLFYFAFIIWATISTVLFSIEYQNITVRTVIQYLFTLQYFVFLINLKFKVDKFEVWIYRFSILLSLTIIALYIYFLKMSPVILTDDMWANKYIPGWPNSVPIPLLMGLWLSFRKRSSLAIKVLVFIALFLTTSRIGFLGGLIIFGYSYLKRMQTNKLWLLVAVPLIGAILSYLFVLDPLLIGRLTVSWDRVEIFRTTMAYLKLRPIWGFGGNTLDQLAEIYGNFSSVKNWGHTHNWLLEMLLRYGIVGTVLFTGFVVSIYAQIRNKDKKFMFILLFGAAFFQTYMRDFTFLFYLLYLSTEDLKSLENALPLKT